MRNIAMAFAAIILLVSCNGNNHNSSENDIDDNYYSPMLQQIDSSIINNDAEAFASMTSYPIIRPYPIKDITDSATMVAYFPTIVDDSLRNMVRNKGLDGWQTMGWRGIMFNNGELWADTYIIAINYISKSEQALLDSLRAQEAASLHPSLNAIDFIPVMCIKDSDTNAIYRIDYCYPDSNRFNTYRLAAYKNGSHLSGKPDVVLDGYLDIQGSSAVHYYNFGPDSVGKQIYFSIDYHEYTEPIYGNVNLSGHSIETHKFKLAYWLDYVNVSK